MNTCPLTNPTQQEVFDYGLRKIIEQGKPSINPQSNACQYRSEDGSRCIVGHMLGDDIDLTNQNSDGVMSLTRTKLPPAYEWMREWGMQRFLVGLQRCHDLASVDSREGLKSFTESFKEKMKAYAGYCELTYKEPA